MDHHYPWQPGRRERWTAGYLHIMPCSAGILGRPTTASSGRDAGNDPGVVARAGGKGGGGLLISVASLLELMMLPEHSMNRLFLVAGGGSNQQGTFLD